MSHQSGTGRRRGTFALASVAALALAGLAGTTSYAAGSGGGPHAPASPRASVPHLDRGFYDVRTTGARAQASLLRTATRAADRPTARASRLTPFDQTLTDIDANTGTVRMRASLDGFLTAASTKAPSTIALGYVQANHTDLGLTPGDLNTFHLARDYRDITGAHHLYFTQRINSQTIMGNGLTATVTKAGQLLTVGGSPMSQSATKIAPVSSSSALPTAGDALAEAQDATAPGADPSQDGVTSGLFVVGGTAHPAYQAIVMSSENPAMVVLDANTGKVLQRRPLVNYENSTGRAYRFFPGAHEGGKQVKVNFTKRHWLSGSAKILSGNNSHTYSDVNDNNRASKNEEVHAKSGHSWGYKLTPFHLPFAKSFCGKPWPCSWNPNKRKSWKTNRAQNATQVFFFVNTWHDHLLKAPIGFTEAAGNFQRVNHGKFGKGGDAVNTQTDDGANTDNGLPDGAHIDNANMGTPPDGRAPQMQMYLQHQPFTSYPGGDPFSPTNVGDEADTVYHEYTHGLSNRLVVDVQGRSTIGGVQAGAMGEAWSDWYAMDYLVDRHLQRDRAAPADVRLFIYDGKGVSLDRTEPIDCKVGQTGAKLCNGALTGHRGGYTYADYGKVVGGPELHGDGVIWAQTLWSLRAIIGSNKSKALVTRAMELAPYNPSFLDMRNAILVADTSLFGGAQRAAIWKVFASRGMGFYAGSFGGNDARPAWSFEQPPASVATSSITGQVKIGTNPAAGVTVRLAFQGAGPVNPTTVTDGNGNYTLTGIPEGTYLKLQASGSGFHTQRTSVDVTSGGAVVNFNQ
jgi:extracellular elastinolytic metalloproteinase